MFQAATEDRDTKISIHSLVKRETNSNIPTNAGIYYFNPLPRKEGDLFRCLCIQVLRNFNPLPRKEGDGRYRTLPDLCKRISIHSLVKRET